YIFACDNKNDLGTGTPEDNCEENDNDQVCYLNKRPYPFEDAEAFYRTYGRGEESSPTATVPDIIIANPPEAANFHASL
ncbi:hypothetical protein Tco_0979557, partial [Tanacetum coccineum]